MTGETNNVRKTTQSTRERRKRQKERHVARIAELESSLRRSESRLEAIFDAAATPGDAVLFNVVKHIEAEWLEEKG